MVDGAKKFDGAKAYKDAKALNMMTVLELHRRLSEKTGTTFNSMCAPRRARAVPPHRTVPHRTVPRTARRSRRAWPPAHRRHPRLPRPNGAPRRSSSPFTLHLTRYPGCIANTDLFREKRDWFRFFFFPTLMKAIGSYVSQAEG